MAAVSRDALPIGGHVDLNGVVFVGIRAIAQLTVDIQSPSPEAAVGFYRKGVGSASRDAFPIGCRADLYRARFVEICAVAPLVVVMPS